VADFIEIDLKVSSTAIQVIICFLFIALKINTIELDLRKF
jgi:hypothetical protein